MLYTPCPERQSARNPRPFLPGQPTDLIRAGNFSKVPWVVGCNSQDAALVAAREYPSTSCAEYPPSEKRYLVTCYADTDVSENNAA
jgi:hypothetical protein